MAADADRLRAALTVLGLRTHTTQEQVRIAYRDLVQVWHPDQFAHNPQLQEAALSKLREYNDAYELLVRYFAETTRTSKKATQDHCSGSAGKAQSVAKPPALPQDGRQPEQRGSAGEKASPRREPTQKAALGGTTTSVIVVGLIIGVLRGCDRAKGPVRPSASQVKKAVAPPRPVALRLDDTPLDLMPDPRADEQLFLLRVLETLYERWPSPADEATRKAAISQHRQLAFQHAEHARSRNLDPAIAEQYEQIAELLNVYDETIDEIARTSREARALIEHQANEDIAQSSSGAGVFAGKAYAGGASGADAILLWAGLTAMDFLIRNNGKSEQITEAERAESSRLVRAFSTRYEEQVARAQSTATRLTEKYGWAAGEAGFDIDAAQGLAVHELVQKGDYREIARLQAAKLRRRSRDPFLLVGHALSRTSATGGAASLSDFEAAAADCVKAARLVPAGSLYDPYRADCVGVAGLLTNLAATNQMAGRGWAAGPFSEGPAAVRLWKTYLALNPTDETGVGRAQLAWALASSGHLWEALEQASDVANRFQRDREFVYNHACLLALNGRTFESFQKLKHAIEQCGYADISHARTDPDLAAVRSTLAWPFNDLTRVKFEWSIDWGMFSDDICLTNSSPFPLTDVSFQAVVCSKGYSDWTQTFRAPRIEPKATQRWNTRIISRGQNATGNGTVICDQGR